LILEYAREKKTSGLAGAEGLRTPNSKPKGKQGREEGKRQQNTSQTNALDGHAQPDQERCSRANLPLSVD